MTRLVFMGTPRAAIPTLRAVAQNWDVAGVFTQPDRPRGRSKRLVPPPVKEAAREMSLPLHQPTSGVELESQLAELAPLDVGVVVAYGRILGATTLQIPAHGFVNVHFSLLPRWRGAAPIERALMAGDSMTGVTIMQMDEGLDTGPVLTAQAIDIPPDDDAGSLTDRLAVTGARLLVSILEGYVDGSVQPVPQTDDGATYASKITSGDRPLDVGSPREEIMARVRGLSPDPAATLTIDGEPHKIFKAAPHEAAPEKGAWSAVDGIPVIGTAGGGVALLELQPPGRNRQSGEDWLRGRRRAGGSVS